MLKNKGKLFYSYLNAKIVFTNIDKTKGQLNEKTSEISVAPLLG